MRLRPASRADLPMIRALHIANWRRDYQDILPAAALRAPLIAYMDAKWTPERINSGGVWVAEDQDIALSGFIACQLDHPEGPYIDNLHVALAARRSGTGRALLARAAEAAGGRCLWLVVLAGNAGARAMYRRLGGQEGPVFDDPILGAVVPALRVTWPEARALVRPCGQP